METVNVTYFVWLNLDDGSIKKGKHCLGLHKCTYLLREESTVPCLCHHLHPSPFSKAQRNTQFLQHILEVTNASCLFAVKPCTFLSDCLNYPYV